MTHAPFASGAMAGKRRLGGTATILVTIAIWLLYGGVAPRGAVRAEAVPNELCLYPTQPPGFIELQSCVVHVTFQCDGEACVLRCEQAYRVHNRDRIKPSTLDLSGAPAEGPWSQIDLRDGSGRIIAKSPAAAAPAWQVTLAPDESKTLLLSYQRSLSSLLFLRWHWDMAPLTHWDDLSACRILLTLPAWTPADAILELGPPTHQFDGRQVIWDYESTSQYDPHYIAFLSPSTVQRIDRLKQEERHGELGQVYWDLRKATQAEGLKIDDPYEQIMAEFLAAIESDPKAAAPRLDLAALYLSRSQGESDIGLNYMLLAAEQLQRALLEHPERTDVAALLAQTYREAALRAQRMGDTAGGLLYLRKAESVPGAAATESHISEEDLALQWALDMAEKGMVSQALVQMNGELAPGLKDALLRYAPPISSARTEIEVGPTRRQVTYLFTLYPPVAEETRTRLRALGGTLAEVEGVGVTMTDPLSATSTITVTMVASYETERELAALADMVQYKLASDRDLLATLMALPWQEDSRPALREKTPWSERYRYHEHVDLVAALDAWAREARYAEWRLVELQGAAPNTDRERLEQRLAIKALQEQHQVWQRFPSGSYWVFRLDWGQGSQEEARAWVLSWGQTRELSVEVVRYRWPFLLRSLGLLLVTLIAVALVIRPGRRNHARRPTSGGMVTT